MRPVLERFQKEGRLIGNLDDLSHALSGAISEGGRVVTTHEAGEALAEVVTNLTGRRHQHFPGG